MANGAVFGAPSIAIGELYFGAVNSTKRDENLRKVDRIVAERPVFSCDAETARHDGFLKARLQAAGMPIPENDMWIAAIALQHGLTLVTRDAHFEAVTDLKLARW
jgi:tRNA(fMet)-specific endonuclease VapC